MPKDLDRKHPWLPVMRALVRCYQAFEKRSSEHIVSLGLTPAQFDVIATLGDTEGMCCRELSEKTLLHKSSLTGVLDQLVKGKLVKRYDDASDRRIVRVALTALGQQKFESVFLPHLEFMRAGHGGATLAELHSIELVLQRLHTFYPEIEC